MILICEPQCIGFEHVKVNSALIKAVKIAFNQEIIYQAEKEHLSYVKNMIGNDSGVTFQEIEVPPKDQSNLGRSKKEFRIVKKVFAQSSALNIDYIIFASIKSPSLIATKYYLRSYKNVKVLVVPHSLIDSINDVPLSRDFFFWIKIWLNFFNTSRLKYLLLGKTIRDELLKEFPKLRDYTEYIDHPYFFAGNKLKDLANSNEIVFGFLGVGYRKKGIEEFITLSRNIKIEYQDWIKFLLVGYIAEDDLEVDDSIYASRSPLLEDDYKEYMEKIDYALLFHKPDDYRYTASGVFFDAISYLKPIIAIKNPFFEYYFEMMGDIGYLCHDYEEMEDIIIKIIKGDKERYHQQQLNILNGRKKINLDVIAKKLKLIMENWE